MPNEMYWDFIKIAGFISCVFAWGWCLSWIVRDGRKRGLNPAEAVLPAMLAGQFAIVVWFFVRPKKLLVEHQPAEYQNPKVAMDHAAKLEELRYWDEAIALFMYIEEKWPEHAEIALQRIQSTIKKRELAKHNTAQPSTSFSQPPPDHHSE